MQGILLFIVIGVVSYLTWRKDRGKDYIWFAWINVVGLLVEVWNYVSSVFLSFSPRITLIINIAFMLVWAAMGALVLKILFFSSSDAGRRSK